MVLSLINQYSYVIHNKLPVVARGGSGFRMKTLLLTYIDLLDSYYAEQPAGQVALLTRLLD
jgi:hypothetical protein